ncbi:hypothetical protein [Paraburkholderia dinghuensis]|uniref:Uncharacterized protein n=1 Tax=Paraburkholderia dinghuensis TaxID=2305225 RepID=A0A3N6MS69_9BURK|nr:hypothetical protein [Paraburkholderia dinghuensis]RQH06628.1 hypothetical protein D1Y85_12205 [Paraburkholderia dinghuensis]
MSTHNLYKGGMPLLMLPYCDSQREYRLPYPLTVAGEYGRGDFTLGDNIQPLYRPYQRAVMKDVQAGDTVNLLVVPGEHSLTELFLKVEPVAPPVTLNCSNCNCPATSMEGVTFDVTGNVYGVDDDALSVAPQSSLTMPAGFSGIDASEESSVHAFLQEYVDFGTVLMLAVRFLTAPTTSGENFGDLAGRISVVAKTHDFQFPWMN